jgi:serine/threonine protein kinase
MSPEQCRSATAIDERSDIYSLGCVFFELLTGRTPFLGELRQLLDAHKRSIAPSASAFADVPATVDALIAQMLAKDPAKRPRSMAELHDTLYSISAIGQPTLSSIPRDVIGQPPSPRDLDTFASGAFTAVRAVPVLPSTAETVLPTPAEFLAMKTDPVQAVPQPLPRKPRAAVLAAGDLASQVISLPKNPSVKYHLAPHLPSLTRSPVRASVMSAAVTFLIAAALTAIAARGHIKPAAADPPPAAGSSGA